MQAELRLYRIRLIVLWALVLASVYARSPDANLTQIMDDHLKVPPGESTRFRLTGSQQSKLQQYLTHFRESVHSIIGGKLTPAHDASAAPPDAGLSLRAVINSAAASPLLRQLLVQMVQPKHSRPC